MCLVFGVKGARFFMVVGFFVVNLLVMIVGFFWLIQCCVVIVCSIVGKFNEMFNTKIFEISYQLSGR